MARQTTDSELVAIRAACHYAYLIRGFAEAKHQRIDVLMPLKTGLDRRQLDELSKASLESPRLCKHFTKTERKIIKAKLGKLSPWRAWSSSYRCEPLGMLLWSLNVPKCGETWQYLERNAIRCVTPEQVRATGWDELWHSLRLRPRSELTRMMNISELFAWRTRVYVMTLTIAIRRKKDDFGPLPVPPPLVRAVRQRTKQAVRDRLANASKDEILLGRRSLLKHLENALPLVHQEYIFFERFRTARWILNPQSSYERTRTLTPLRFKVDPKYFTNLTFIRTLFDPPSHHWAANY